MNFNPIFIFLLFICCHSLTETKCCCEDCHGGDNVQLIKLSGVSCNDLCTSGKYYYRRDNKRDSDLLCKSADGWCFDPLMTDHTPKLNPYGVGGNLRDLIITFGLGKSSGWKPNKYLGFGECKQVSANKITASFPLDIQNEDNMNATFYNTILKPAALDALNHFWSRRSSPVRLGSKNVYLDTNFYHQRDSKMGIDLYVETGSEWERSTNPIIWDPSVYFQEGFYREHYEDRQGGWFDIAIKSFKKTMAHEFGHTILYVYDGIGLTSTHKGSSTFYGENNHEFEYPPPPAKYDVMIYYNGNVLSQEDWYERAEVVDEDMFAIIASCERFTIEKPVTTTFRKFNFPIFNIQLRKSLWKKPLL